MWMAWYIQDVRQAMASSPAIELNLSPSLQKIKTPHTSGAAIGHCMLMQASYTYHVYMLPKFNQHAWNDSQAVS